MAGPLIAVKLNILTRKSLGGLHTNLDAQALDAKGDVIPGLSDLPHAGLDVEKGLLNRPDAAELLRKASTR